MFLGVKQSRERVEDMVKAMLEGELPEDLKAALTDWLEHVNDSEGTRERAEALTAVLENTKTTAINALLCMTRSNSSLNAATGSSAATAGLMISAMAVWIMYWHPARMSMLWYSIPRYIPTPAVNPPNLLRLRQSLNLLPAAKDQEERPWHDGYELWLCICCTGCYGCRQEPDSEGYCRSRGL